MANTKKPVENIEPAPKKKLDKRFIVIVSLCVVIIAATVVTLLVVRGDFKNIKHWATTTESTEPPVTVDSEKVAEEALWKEHVALFTELKNIYWLGNFDNYKSTMPQHVWEKMARDEGVTVDEMYALVEKSLSEMALEPHKDTRFYITETNLLKDEEFSDLAGRFAKTYEMDVSDIEEMYELKVEVVAIIDGERKSETDTYYSLKIDGVRYLANETGFLMG